MTTVTQKVFDSVPPGTYPARLSAVTDKGLTATAYGPRDMVELEFLLDNGKRLTRRYTKSLHPKANLHPVVSVFMNGQPIPQTVELERFIGAPVRLVVVLVPTKNGLGAWSRINEVLPPAPPPPTYQPQPAPAYYPPPTYPAAQSFVIPPQEPRQ